MKKSSTKPFLKAVNMDIKVSIVLSSLFILSILSILACSGNVGKNAGVGTDSSTSYGDGGMDAGQDGGTDAGDDGGTDTDSECISDIIDCTTRCGNIKDNCTDEVHNCGGCELGKVCDIVTNNCVEPLITCDDLDAECGLIKNSCGVRLSCGYCEIDEECDADTNKCVACSNPTCADLGIECGSAWNGCGKRQNPQNQLDCPECTGGMICNPVFNICNPDCTPDTTENICNQALLDFGVECGVISDSCGDIVDCGNDCDEGEGCGVRGVANVCSVPERPLECEVVGWECGLRDSECQGEQIDCGTCPEGEICRDNHTCGQPCEPLTCLTGYAGQCGQQLDDGCEGAIDCNCSGGLVCDALVPGEAGTCETLKTCVDYTDGTDGQRCSNGANPGFPRGDEINLTCPCADGRYCIDSGGNVATGEEEGTCCTNTGVCDGTHCTALNTCTGENEYCCNESTQYCSGDICTPRLECDEISYGGNFADGSKDAPCSNYGNEIFDDGSGDSDYFLACPCYGGRTCEDGGGPTPGTCCENESTCDNAAWNGNCEVPNDCTGGSPDTCCAWNQCCMTNSTCEAQDNCTDYTDGQLGSPCSNNLFFDECPPESVDASKMICNCGSGLCCVQPNPDAAGSCVAEPVCDGTCEVDDTCNPGETINCCAWDECCESDACVPRETCADPYNANGQEGDICSNGPSDAFTRCVGSNLTCPCTDGRFCIDTNGDEVSGNDTGTCCTNTAPPCSGIDGPCQSVNTCTGEVTECCGGNACCDSDTCIPRETCSTYNADGEEGQICSNGSSDAFPRCKGNNLECDCDGSLLCIDGSGNIVSGNDTGTCCNDTAPSCSGLNGPCQSVNTCTGDVTECCNGNQYCDGGVCVAKNTCSTYTSGDLGSDCSDVLNTNFPDGDGTDLACPCSTSGGWGNLTCSGDSPTVTGTCTCSADSCSNCSETGQSDGCGGTLSCDCPTETPICDTSPAPGTCCAQFECPTEAGQPCGIPHTDCGNTVTCSCPDQYETCVDNVCTCTPIDPCPGQTGMQQDNCGNWIDCGA